MFCFWNHCFSFYYLKYFTRWVFLKMCQLIMTYISRSELEQTLEKVQLELDSLREQRSQQVKMTESIAKQRDMYRVLLAQATGVSFPQQGSIFASPVDFIQSLKWLCWIRCFCFGKHYNVFFPYFFFFIRCTTWGALPHVDSPTSTCCHACPWNTDCTRHHGHRFSRSPGGKGSSQTGELRHLLPSSANK